MRSSIALVLTAAALVPAVAAAAPTAERSFTRDGHTYVYSLTPNQDGTTLIQGHEVGSHGRFRLTVNGTRVSGQANGRDVSFRTARPLAPVSVAAN
jgi:hypothetical protein